MEGEKEHESDQEDVAYQVDICLYFPVDRPAKDHFDYYEHNAASIQSRDRKKIHKAEVD